MNVFYFVNRFPRRYRTANQQKIFSLAQSFLNLGHEINFVSADQSNPKQYQHLNQYPVKLIHISPKRIGPSLSASQQKPDIALFNNFEMEQMYSAYLYNKWNKCPRILQVNYANGLQNWRKSRYSTNSDKFLVPYNDNLYDTKHNFIEYQRKAMLRSDFYFTPNDFLYYLVKNEIKQNDRLSIMSHGFPTKQYNSQIKNQQFRPFENRKNFIFVADFCRQHSIRMFYALNSSIWPLIKKQLPDAQLHIYTSSENQLKAFLKKNNLIRTQIQAKGIFMKGYVQDIQIIQKYKALLYPARSSVGLKSKVLQSWLHHTPVVTTPIGAQGIFYDTIQPKFSLSQSSNDSGFVNQREFTKQQIQGQKKILNYYNANSLNYAGLKNISFGGSFLNYSNLQFAKSAVQMYNNKQKWEKSLKIGQKSILKNQNQFQLQINLQQAMLKLQLAMYKTRGSKGYQQQWRRYLRSKQYQKKVYQYK